MFCLFVLFVGSRECFEEVEMEGRESMYDVLLETALVTNGPCIIKSDKKYKKESYHHQLI